MKRIKIKFIDFDDVGNADFLIVAVVVANIAQDILQGFAVAVEVVDAIVVAVAGINRVAVVAAIVVDMDVVAAIVGE